jgi:7,8-dihydroneopterin aldolase/epimerase/oxygenase
MSDPADNIHIEALELRARIGVSAAERAQPQRLTVALTLEPVAGLRGLGDRIEETVDYAAVCAAVGRLAGEGERSLLETLAEEIAALVLERYPLRAVEIELRKFILPDTAWVAVRIRRETAGPAAAGPVRQTEWIKRTGLRRET